MQPGALHGAAREQLLEPFRLTHESELVRDSDGLRARSDLELTQHSGDVMIDRLRRQEQLLRELRVRASRREQAEDLELAMRQPMWMVGAAARALR